MILDSGIRQELINNSTNIFYMERYIRYIENYTLDSNTSESHHVLPESLFPKYKYKKINRIRLSLRAHYIAHRLLAKAMNTPQNWGAVWAMCNRQNKPIPSRVYEKAKLLKFKNFTPKLKGKVLAQQDGKLVYVDKLLHSTGKYNCINKNKISVKNLAGQNVQVSLDEFNTNRSSYISHTDGHCTVLDVESNVLHISCEEFKNNRNKYFGNTKGTVPVYDYINNLKKRVSRTEFDNNPDQYKAINKGIVYAYSTLTNKKVTVTVEEYKNHSDLYYKKPYRTRKDKGLKRKEAA